MLPAGFPQDLLARTCTRSCKDTGRISPGPLQELLTRTCRRSCKGLWQHLIRISTRSSAAARADLTRSWCKNLPRASHKSFHTSTSNREEFSRISTRARLCENFQWKKWEEFTRSTERLSKNAPILYFCQGQVPKNAIFDPFKTWSNFTKYCPCHKKATSKSTYHVDSLPTTANFLAPCKKSHTSSPVKNIQGQNLYSNLRSRHGHGHLTRAIAQLKCTLTSHMSNFRREFKGKMPGPRECTLI